MNKKGFTLIELLVTIIILGLILGVAAPMLMRYYMEAKDKTYNTYVETLYNGARMYLEKNSMDKPEAKSSIVVTAKTLKDGGFIDDLKDATKRGVDCNYEESKVEIVNNTAKGVIRDNDDFTYKVTLVCPKKTITDKIMDK